MATKTHIKTDKFKLYEDKNGKFWLWVESHGCNYAMKEKDKETALVKAIDLLIFSHSLQKEYRNKAEGKLRKLSDFLTDLAEPDYEGEKPYIDFID